MRITDIGRNRSCNYLSLPLADIVLFGLSLSGFLSRVFKTRLLKRDFHTLIKNVSFPSPIGHSFGNSYRKHVFTKLLSQKEQKEIVHSFGSASFSMFITIDTRVAK